jgi:hypothetical protein
VIYSAELFWHGLKITCVQAKELTENQIEEVVLADRLLEKDSPTLVDWIEYLLAWLEVLVKALLHSSRAK